MPRAFLMGTSMFIPGTSVCTVLLLKAVGKPKSTFHACREQQLGLMKQGTSIQSVPNTAEMLYTKFCVVRICKYKEDLDKYKYLARI